MGTEPFDAGDGPEAKAQRARKIKAAMAWLRIEMMAGPRLARELTDQGRTLGHAPSTLAIARQRLHLYSIREGNRSIWYTPIQWRAAKAAASKLLF